MTSRKTIYLFLAILLPIGLTFFFRYCSKAQFDVPVYYADGAPSSSGCPSSGSGAYFVPDSVLRDMGVPVRGKLVWILTDSASTEEVKWQRSNVMEHEKEVHVVTLPENELTNRIKACYVFLPLGSSSVILDEQRRIRGYYGVSRKETDRLITEIKILIQNKP